MKDNPNIPTEELILLSEEMESMDKQVTLLDPNNPVESQLQKNLKSRMKLIAQAFQGNQVAYKKLRSTKVSGFYQ